MSLDLVPLLISVLALITAIGSFLSSRQASWSYRYFSRWFELAKLVLDHPTTLWPLWCSQSLYKQYCETALPTERAPDPLELVFTEMYVDFVYEVHRRGRWLAFLSGRYPGTVPLTNPRARHIYREFIRQLYPEDARKIIDAALAGGQSKEWITGAGGDSKPQVLVGKPGGAETLQPPKSAN